MEKIVSREKGLIGYRGKQQSGVSRKLEKQVFS